MRIRLGYDIQFDVFRSVPVVAMLNVHPSRAGDLLEPDQLRIEPDVEKEPYTDAFGNLCCRFTAPAGHIRLWNSTLIEDSGNVDASDLSAREIPVADLPPEVLVFLLAAGAGDLRLGAPQCHFRLSVCQPDKDRARRLPGPDRRVPRLSAPSDYFLPVAEYSSAVCHWISGRHLRAADQRGHGLQRMVRSLSGRPLVDFRRAE